MKISNIGKNAIFLLATFCVIPITASPMLAADSAPAPANATVPANPFGPKPAAAPVAPALAPGETFVAVLRVMLLRRFDKDGDGQLNAAELGEARKVLSGGVDDRIPTAAEAQAAARGPLFGLRPLIMQRFDHNGTGRLDDAELAEVSAVLFGLANASPAQSDDLAVLQKSIIKHFDKKGDGQLDADERAAAKAWLAQVAADLDKQAAVKPAGEMK